MKFNKEIYLISKETLVKVNEALGANWFHSDGQDEWNNDEVINAHKSLKKEIEEQEEPKEMIEISPVDFF